MDITPGTMSNEYQVFATIYETEGLEHHMAVERAHVSWTLDGKEKEVNIFVSYI